MSKEIDEKVVELRFNNSNFERNARATMSTIDKLEEKLNFKGATKGLQNVDKAASSIKLTVLSDAVDKVNVKFNALQVAAFTCLQNITNKAIDTGERLIKSLSVDQISAGWAKYEAVTTSTQTIMAATGESIDTVSKSLDKLNWFTDETSYSFSDMADNIGKFTSAGQNLDDSTSAMMGIATAAALAGQNSTVATRAMVNFSQAMGTGFMGLQDWKSVETANMATEEFKQTLIDTAIELGTLEQVGDVVRVAGEKTEVTTTAFRDTLKKQWMTSDVMIAALKKYGDYAENLYTVVQETGLSAADAMELVGDNAMELGEKAFRAAQEAKTFTDAIEATKDAVSTGWMKTFQLLFGNYIEAKETWTDLTDRLYTLFAEGGNFRNEVLTGAMTSSLDQFKTKVKEAGGDVDEFEQTLINLARESGIEIDYLIDKYKSFDNVLTNVETKQYSDQIVKLIPKALRSLAGEANSATLSTEDLNAKLEEYNDLVYRIAIKGEFGNGQTRFAALEKMGYDWKEIQGYVNRFVESGGTAKVTIDDLSDAELKNIGYTDEEINKLRALADEAEITGSDINELMNSFSKPSGRVLLAESLMNILDALIHVIDTVKEAWSEIFPAPTAEMIYKLIEKFHDFTENLMLNEERTDQLKRTFKGLFAVLDVIRQVVVAVVQNGFNLIGRVMDMAGIDVMEFTATLGDNLVGIRDWLNEGNKIAVVVEWIADKIFNLITTFKEWGKQLVESDKVSVFIKTLRDKFEEHFPSLSDWIKGLKASFNDFMEKMKELDGFSLKNLEQAIKNFGDTVWKYITNIDISPVKNTFKDLRDTITNFFKDTGRNVWNFVKDMTSAVTETVKNINPLAFVLVAAGGAMLLLGQNVIITVDTLIKTLLPLTTAIKGLINATQGFVNEGSKAIKRLSRAFSATLIGATLIEFAVAIGVLTVAIYALLKIDPAKLWATIGAITVLAAVMTGMTVVISKFGGNAFALMTAAGLFISLASAILILSYSVKQFEYMKFTNILNAVGGIALLTVILTGAIIVLSNFSGKSVGFSLSMISFAAAISILVIVISQLDSLDIGKVTLKLIALGAIIATIFGISALASSTAGVFGAGHFFNALGLIGFIVAINMLITTIKNIDEGSLVIASEHLDSFIAILAVMALAVSTTILTGKYAAKAGVALLAISVAVLVLVSVVKQFAKIDKADLNKSAIVIGGLMLVFGAIIALSKLAGENALKAGGMILMMAVAIDALAVVLWGLSLLDKDGVTRATIVIDSILAMFTVLLKFSNVNERAKAAIVSMTVCLGILMTGLGVLLAFHNGDELLKAAGSISLILISLIGIFAVLNKSRYSFKRISPLLGFMAILLAEVTIVIAALQKIPNTEGLIEKTAAISLLMLTISAIVLATSKLDLMMVNVGNLSSLALFALELTVVLASLGALIRFCITNITVSDIESFKVSMLALTGLFVILSATAGVLSSFYYKPMGNQQQMALFLVELSGVLWLLGVAMIEINEVNPEGMIKKVASLSILLVAVSGVAALLGKLTLTNTNFLPTLGMLLGLSAVCYVLAQVLIAMEQVDAEKGIQNVILMAALMAEIVVFTLITVGLGAIFKNVDPATIGIGLAGVIAVTTIIYALLMLLGHMYSEPLIADLLNGGFAALGEQLGSFIGGLSKGFEDASGNSLVNTAQSIKEACDIIKTIDTTAVDILTHLLDSISQVATSLSVSGILGKSDWSSVTDGLVELANAMTEYADVVKTLDDMSIAAIERSIAPTESLIAVLDTIPKTEGFLPSIFGKSEWKTLSSGLAEYAFALCAFAATLRGKYNPIPSRTQPPGFGNAGARKITEVLPVTENLISLLTKLPRADGYWQFLVGEYSWDTITNGLVGYAQALCKFSAYVSGEYASMGYPEPDAAAIQNAVSCTEALINVMHAIPDTNEQKSLWEKLFGETKGGNTTTASYWKVITNGLGDYGTSLANFGNIVKVIYDNNSAQAIWYIGYATESLIQVIKIISELDNINIKKDIWEYFYSGLNDYGNALREFSDIARLVDTTVISNTALAAKDLIDIFRINDFSKDSMAAFSDNIGILGVGIADYSDAVVNSSYSRELITDTILITQALNVLSDVTNNKKINTKFLEGLTAYGEALHSFFNDIIDVDTVKTSGALSTAASMLKEYGKAIEEYNDTFSLGTRTSSSLTTFASKLQSYGSYIKSFADTITTIESGTYSLDYCFSQPSKFTKNWLETAEGISIDTITKLTDFGRALKEYGEDLRKFSDKLKDVDNTKFASVGKFLVDGISLGIEKELPNLIETINSLADDVIEALRERLGIRSPSKVTKEDGKYYILGFVEGIGNYTVAATKSVVIAADKIIEAFNDELGIHSNSDETIASGEFFLGGFMESIQNGWGNVTETIKKLATDVIDSFDLSKITEIGGDITAILSGDFSALMNEFDKNDYTAKMEEYTKQLEAMTAAGQQDTDTFKELQKQMNEFQSSNQSAYNYVLNEELNEAKSLYDRLLDDFKKGKIAAGEFDKQYVNLLKKYSDQAGDLINYHKDQISDYISGSLEEIQSAFEDKISDINSKMDSLKNNLSKTYDDALIYTTHQDIYNKKVSEYENQISKLNRSLDETKQRYGENSSEAKKLQNQLRLVNEEMESYKSFYETEGFKDDEIIDIAWSDELNKETEALFDYADAIEKMQKKYGKDITDPLIEYIGTLDKEKGKKTVDWLNSLSGEELSRMSSELQANAEAARRVAEMLYRPQMEAATEEFDTAITNLRNKLPDTAVSIGADVAKGLTNGFSEEVENSLERIGTSGDKLLDALKERFGIHSPSKVAKEEIGYNLADGVINGVIERLLSSSSRMAEAVKTFVYTAFAPMMFDEEGNNPIATEFSKVIASINEALLSGINTQPVIRPVLDLSNVYTGVGELNSMFGYESANQINGYMNSAREIQNRPLINAPVSERGGTTNYFTQNNYSPKALTRREIGEDTKRIMQLATQART